MDIAIWHLHLTSLLFPRAFQSAIGEGMTRKDHSDVSNQVSLGWPSLRFGWI